MKTIGILGGMSWESTSEYYRLLNQLTKERLGGLHSARLLLHSVDFAEIEAMQRNGDWHTAGQTLGDAAAGLERAGAEIPLLATNTMHLVADAITARISVPFLHIADATADAAFAQGFTKVGLLGTRFTMQQPFYRDRLRERRDIDVLLPDNETMPELDRVIFEELCCGVLRDDSRDTYLAAIRNLQERGAQAVVLGCTEIGLLVGPSDTTMPLLDTTRIHAEAALDLALAT